MTITEIVKSFLTTPKDASDKMSSGVDISNIKQDLTDNDKIFGTGVFFDNSTQNLSSTFFGNKTAFHELLSKQKEKILAYRQIAKNSDVDNALEEIVNEVIFTFDDKDPLKIQFENENEKITEKIQESFDKIKKIMNVKKNLYFIVKSTYIDGQIVMHIGFDKNSSKSGIKTIKLIEPCLLYFDKESGMYKYYKEKDGYGINTNDEIAYSYEEIIREDFGQKEGMITLSYLEKAIKSANQLKTLEDLLIPMRFSRSISRRVFNVDIGDLPAKRGAEVMVEHQNKFKYKKFYNAETGEISNQQHITSMVEDYWFANRSGGKGTTVETIDETGNLGELNDILYFSKKLYKAMNVPLGRLKMDPDSDHDFEFQGTRTSKEDIKFFQFISRVRLVYIEVFKELLKRDLVSTGIMTESEWNEMEDEIRIYFSNDNSFVEMMNTENFLKKLEVYAAAAEYAGKLFPVSKILKDVFKMSDEELDENFKEIEKESKDKRYAKFYQTDET